MAIHTQYRLIITCDTCGKTIKRKSDIPPSSQVPEDWIQTAPPGLIVMKEFCSIECLRNWKNPVPPWTDDDDIEEEYAVIDEGNGG